MGSYNSLYQATSGCTDCPMRAACIKSSTARNEYRKLWIDIGTERMRRRSEENFTTWNRPLIRGKRSIQAEGSFAMIKDGMGFRRFTYRDEAGKTGQPQLFIGDGPETA